MWPCQIRQRRWQLERTYRNREPRYCNFNLGTILEEVEKTTKKLEANGVSVTIADARFAKPIDKDLLEHLVAHRKILFDCCLIKPLAVFRRMRCSIL